MRNRGLALLAGVLLVAAFVGLDRTTVGMHVGFFPIWGNSTPGELLFWLGFVVLLSPGSLLVGWSVAPFFSGPVETLWARCNALSSSQWRLLVIGVGGAVTVLALVGHFLVLGGFPFTDDEYAVRLGGRILAGGMSMAEVPDGFAAYPSFFLMVQDGMYTSMDWLGGLLAWSLAEVTGTGPLLYALASGITVVAVAVAVSRQLTPAWGVAAGLVLAMSPMFQMLSMTTHAQIISRMFVAVFLVLYLLADSGLSKVLWALTGLSFGAAVLCRPAESVGLCLPFLVDITWRAARGGKSTRRGLFWLVAGGLLPALVFVAYNYAVTGAWWRPPRYVDRDQLLNTNRNPLEEGLSGLTLLWQRFGGNCAHNALRLAVFFLGPVGMVGLLLGMNVSRMTKVASAAIGFHLLLGLLHGDYGIHAAGPAHYSETVVLLVFVFVHGMHRGVGLVRRLGGRAGRAGVTIAIGLILSMGIFSTWHGAALRDQARIHATIYGLFDHPDFDNSVVLAPPYSAVWRQVPEFAKRGTFVFDWRKPDPITPRRTVILHDRPEVLPALEHQFKGRKVFRLLLLKKEPWLQIVPVERQ